MECFTGEDIILTLNEFAVDYFRATTYSETVANDWRMKIFADEERSRLKEDGAKFQQYEGFTIHLEDGTIFWGKGVQGKSRRRHWVLSVTGRLSDRVFFGDLRGLYIDHSRVSLIKPTRIDLQVTRRDTAVFLGDEESILFLRSAEREIAEREEPRATGWAQDKAGKNALATLSVNKRERETYYRFYAKPTAKGHALRYEVEYKGAKARAVGAALQSNTTRDKIGRILKNQLNTLKSDILTDFFSPSLPDGGDRVPVAARDGLTNTALWLMKTVLPAFARVVNGDDMGDYVATAFMEVLAGCEWGKENIITDDNTELEEEE